MRGKKKDKLVFVGHAKLPCTKNIFINWYMLHHRICLNHTLFLKTCPRYHIIIQISKLLHVALLELGELKFCIYIIQNPAIIQINVKSYSYISNSNKKGKLYCYPDITCRFISLLFMLTNPNPKAAAFWFWLCDWSNTEKF